MGRHQSLPVPPSASRVPTLSSLWLAGLAGRRYMGLAPCGAPIANHYRPSGAHRRHRRHTAAVCGRREVLYSDLEYAIEEKYTECSIHLYDRKLHSLIHSLSI